MAVMPVQLDALDSRRSRWFSSSALLKKVLAAGACARITHAGMHQAMHDPQRK